MESAFGQDFSNVKVQTGNPDAMQALGAKAFTQGETIVLPGRLTDNTNSRKLLAHELTHVVQQRNARESGDASEAVSTVGDASEVEATQVAETVAKGGRTPRIKATPRAGIQRQATQSGASFPPGFDPQAKARQIHAAFDGWGTDESEVYAVLYTGRRELTRAIHQAYDTMYSPDLRTEIYDEMSGAELNKAIHLLENARLTLVDKVREAAEGWGTNEEAIFMALERATKQEMEELKKDAHCMRLLRDDLNDSDYALALAFVNGNGMLAAKLRRAVNGWGTDEEAIWRALKTAPESELKELRQPGHLRTGILGDLRGDLNDTDYMRAVRTIDGTLTSLDKIEIACAGWGTDEAGVKSALGAMTADEYNKLKGGTAKVKGIGALESMLESELSGADLLEAQLTFHQKRLAYDGDYKEKYMADQAKSMGADAVADAGATVLVAAEGQSMSAVGRIKVACKGAGTDEQTIWQVLASLNPQERSFILLHNPESVLTVMRDDLGLTDFLRALRSLRSDSAESAVAMLELAVYGAGTDEKLIYDLLDRILKEGAAAQILAQAPLLRRVREDVSREQYAVFTGVLKSGTFSSMDRLKWATAMAGTDEELVFELCGKYKAEWWTGGAIKPEVDAILKSELSTSDYWKASDLVRGEPKTEEERLARAKEQLDRERSGGVSDGIMDSLGYSGANAEQAWMDYQETYNQAYEDGELSEDETKSLRRDEEMSQHMLAEYQSAKASVAQWATNIAMAIVGIVATILTAGAAGPAFVLAMSQTLAHNVIVAASFMVAGAVTKVGLNKAILGEGYDLSSAQALVDAVSGSVEVGLSLVSGPLANKMVEGLGATVKGVGPAVERVFGQAGKRILTAGLDSGVDGTMGGVSDGLVSALGADETWSGGFEKAFTSISTSALLNGSIGGVGGFAAGGGLKAFGEVFGPKVAGAVDVNGADVAADAADTQVAHTVVDAADTGVTHTVADAADTQATHAVADAADTQATHAVADAADTQVTHTVADAADTQATHAVAEHVDDAAGDVASDATTRSARSATEGQVPKQAALDELDQWVSDNIDATEAVATGAGKAEAKATAEVSEDLAGGVAEGVVDQAPGDVSHSVQQVGTQATEAATEEEAKSVSTMALEGAYSASVTRTWGAAAEEMKSDYKAPDADRPAEQASEEKKDGSFLDSLPAWFFFWRDSDSSDRRRRPDAGQDRMPGVDPMRDPRLAPVALARTQADPMEATHGHEHDDRQATGGGDGSLPATKKDALKRHERNTAKMKKIIRSGLAQNPNPSMGFESRVNLFHNAAEWIDQGMANMTILTPTHDSGTRTNVGAGKQAYFDPTKTWTDAGANYDETNLGPQPQVEVDNEGVIGGMANDGLKLTLNDPVGMSESLLVETLIHEVQHDADQSASSAAWRVPDGGSGEAPEWAYNNYQSEFRAYWLENAEGSPSDQFGSSTDLDVTQYNVAAQIDAAGTTKTATTGFKNKRQHDIFTHLRGANRMSGDWWDYAKNEWKDTYGYVPYYYAADTEFRGMVNKYDSPRSGNAINSVRIQRLSMAIGQTCGGADEEAVYAAAEALDPVDKGYLSDRSQSLPFWQQAESVLDPTQLTILQWYVNDGAPQTRVCSEADTYTVVDGDTLWDIADRMLGDSVRWRVLYKANRKRIGSNPNRIRAGQVLSLP